MKKKLFSIFALLLTLVTQGAWAQDDPNAVAVTPVPEQTNQWTLTMPAGNVVLNVEYEPEYTATFKALTGYTIGADKATVTVTEGGQSYNGATMTNGKLTPLYAGQTVTLTAKDGYKFRSVEAKKAVSAKTPLTMECLTDGTIKVDMGSGTLSTGMKYAVNGGTKTTITETTEISGLQTGDKVQFYGNGTQTQVYGNSPGVRITGGSAKVKVYGNIMSLLDEENFATKVDLPAEDYIFSGLFGGYKNLKDASGLLLPATTLAEYCYASMFQGCEALTAAPALPATTLASFCYASMFQGCDALTAAPALPATTLASFCYAYMFYGCRNLASVTCLATNISASVALDYWLYGVAASGTFTTPASTGWTLNSTSGIPEGWTRVDAE